MNGTAGILRLKEQFLELQEQLAAEKARADKAEALVASYDRQDELIGTEFEGVDEVTEVIRLLKLQLAETTRLCASHRESADKAEASVAEMREAFKFFECTLCDENHKFKPECIACVSGQPSGCTCDKEPLVDCPCCMEGECAEGYRKLRHAIAELNKEAK
jgi:hypothetical protein